jgi:hypothetical protein
LWRKSNPALGEATRERLVKELMSARRTVHDAKGDPEAMKTARHLVDQAKVALGERGAPWWDDGAPDYNRHLAKNTPYADRFVASRNRLSSNQQLRLGNDRGIRKCRPLHRRR